MSLRGGHSENDEKVRRLVLDLRTRPKMTEDLMFLILHAPWSSLAFYRAQLCLLHHVSCYHFLLQSCQFMKNFTETALHVYFDGNLRIYNCNSCCSRWYFTFNDAECSSPGSIDGAFYMAAGAGKSLNLHRHRHIEGHCNNIHKGKVRVGFWVGNCNTGHKLADAYTGWTTMSRIFIEEVSRSQ